MVNYVVAIPTYNRHDVLSYKTLRTLTEGRVRPQRIFLFVANQEEYRVYEEAVPRHLYRQIIVGKKGITNQRKFIANYFPEGQYVISMDDDVESFEILRDDRLVQIKDVDRFFNDAYHVLRKEHLFLWGIYPVRNPYFMYPNTTTDLRFVIGVTFGFIVRHSKKLEPSIHSETKEDYEQTILYFKMDGGIVRFNHITAKTKFNAPGGLGTDRYERNKHAAEYLERTYPEIIKVFTRKNGMYEVKMTRLPRLF